MNSRPSLVLSVGVVVTFPKGPKVKNFKIKNWVNQSKPQKKNPIWRRTS
jgi:hypothetical protein